FDGGVQIDKLVPMGVGNGTFLFKNRKQLAFTGIENLSQAALVASVIQTGKNTFSIGVTARVANQVSGAAIQAPPIPSNAFIVSPQLVNLVQPFGAGRLAVADVNGDGIPDLIVAQGPNNAPLVTIFDGSSIFTQAAAGATSQSRVRTLAQFFAYDPRFVGGVFVA